MQHMQPARRILMIVSDQHRADCLGAYGNPAIQTPNLDRLAEQGIRFDSAYCPIPTCCPTRQSMLSGMRPESFGGLWNYDIGLKIPALEPCTDTWTKMLKEEGYRMGYAGKWHVNPNHDPLEYGFDTYFPGSSFLQTKEHALNGNLSLYLGETDPLPLEETHTHCLAKKAADMIQKYESEGRPWHIRLDFNEPHLPCRPAKPFSRMYSSSGIPVWGSLGEDFRNKPYIQHQQLYNWGVQDFTWEDWAPVVARYYGIISQMDDANGHVLKTLKKLGIEEDTLVIYTSDHGDMCGAHRMIDKHYVLYEDVTRVPLILRWPAVLGRAARVEHNFVCNALDIAATMYAMFGREFSRLHGLPLPLPASGTSPEMDLPAPVFREYIISTYNGQQFGLYTSRMIRTRRWKYIWNTTDIDELYDLEQDPHELDNRIRSRDTKGIVEELRYLLYNELS
ncbi:MAG TPA: sulfatase, partial [Clostridiales bacterium]|nr:sulfatase [Clostridiales bacterium]